MKRPLDISVLALDDMRAARDWYEAQQPGLGSEFVRCLHAALARIVRNPTAFPLVHADVRRCLTQRFPYGVFFREEPQALLVVAVYHTHRDPIDWRSRVTAEEGGMG